MYSIRWLCLGVLVSSSCYLWAAEPSEQFLRVRRNDDKKVIALDTAVTKYFIPARKLPKVNPRANTATEDGRTALHIAAEKGYTDIVKKLLSEGANPDAKTTDGKTPLLLATEGGHKKIVELLLAAKKSAVKAARPAPGEVTIDLISAVHIGDAGYYSKLNDLFTEYDVVLYELVAPKNSVPERKDDEDNPLRFLQLGVGELLELEHQIDGIDYKKENFVHADMSPKEVMKSMNDRGESMLKMVLRSLAADAPPTKKEDLEDLPQDFEGIVNLMLSPDRAVTLKRIMASQFENLDSQMAVLFPGGSTIITERNKVALKVLKEQIAAGKKKIAIFYGAGHMADMSQRLKQDFHAVQYENIFLTAWDLTKGKRRNPFRLPFKIDLK